MEKSKEINDNNYPDIYCRFRPATKKELEYSQEQISPMLSKTTLNINTSKEKDIYTFDFNHIFFPNDTQQDVYDICAKKSVENFLLGYNSAIIIHGQKKTGKSYTMTGKIDDNNLKGIIPRVVKDVFEFIYDNENLEFIIKVSIIDIYKDKIKDLITNNDINLIENLDNDIINFEGIHEKYINNENEVLKILEKGINNKAKLDYNINLDGKFAKSNFIFILRLIQNNKKENISTKSELIFMETSGEEILYPKDNSNIKDQSSIPSLFNKIFNGNYRTSLIITCSPSIYHQEITLQYLRFAEKIKKIKNNAKINEEVNYDKLKEQLKLSETKIKQLEKLISMQNDKDGYNNKKEINFDDIFKNILDSINGENKENLMENLYSLKERYDSDIDNLNKKINDLEQKIKINKEIKNKFQNALINQQTKILEYNNIFKEFKQFITELKTSKEININQKKRQIIDLDNKLKNIDSNNNNDINNIDMDIDNTSFKKENKTFNNLILIKDIELFYNNNKNEIIRNNSEEIKSEKYAQTVVNQSKIEKIELDYEKDIKYLRQCLEENKDIILELKDEIINLQNKNKILENNALLNERKIRDKNILLENNILELKKKYEESQVKRLILEDKCRKLNKIFMNKKMNWLNSKDESINKSISTPKNIIKILKGDEENKI